VAWGEKYVAVPDDSTDGVSSWEILSSPTGWTSGIVLGNQSYNTGSGAYPVWRTANSADALGIANMNDPSFVFTFRVLISNPDTAFEPDGSMRMYFGGFKDDTYSGGDGNYEVSGVMDLQPVPEPGTLLLVGTGVAGIVRAARKRKKQA
jgi:hypothetical protein